jgi:large subunit ribosomal protein L35
MPKMKTNRTARKKLFPNKNGKVKRAQAFHSHNTAKKSPKRRRNLSKMGQVDKTNLRDVRRMLPYA